MEYCSKCEDVLPSNGVYVSCRGCDSRLHFKCSTLNENTYARMSASRKACWRCELCRIIKKLGEKIETSEAISDLKRTVEDVLVKLDDCITAHNSLREKLDVVHNEQAKLRSDFLNLEKRVNEFDNMGGNNDSAVNVLANRVCELEQAALGRELVVYGVVEKENENLMNVITKIAEKISIPFQQSSVETVKRMFQKRRNGDKDHSKPRPIRVAFTSAAVRNVFVEKKRVALVNEDILVNGGGEKIAIYEMLTAHNKRLMWEARKKARELGWKYVWFSYGMLRARKTEGSGVVFIRSNSDLNKIV